MSLLQAPVRKIAARIRIRTIACLSAIISILIACCFPAASSAQNCSGVSVGFKPLTEFGSTLYKGYSGGLFPGGRNDRPSAHDILGRSIAAQIQPLNSSGNPSSSQGKIVLLSIGMSNTTQEFSTFKTLADKDSLKNPSLAIVDGAQGGQTAAIISNPAAAFWSTVDQRLTSAGLTRLQVQVVWLKEADASPTQPFPSHALTLQNELETIVRLLKSRYPNVRIVYVSSRTYAGYATTTLNPEPFAYESGFAVKWMIEKQISGDTSLSCAGPNARAPWITWGPYLWANGTTPRVDGFCWECADCQTDGTHPSPRGQAKVANLLLSFLKSDPTSVPWFIRSSTAAIGDDPSQNPTSVRLDQNYPNPFNPTTAIRYELMANSLVKLSIFDLLGQEVEVLVNSVELPGLHTVRWNASNFPGGTYVYTLRAVTGERTVLTVSKKMLLLK